MHELSLSGAIVDTVIAHANGRRVTKVTMTIGALRQVVPDSLDFYFGIVARDTVVEGATLEQNYIPCRVRCEQCEKEWELDVPVFVCADCGREVEPLSGTEFEVDSIEVEEEARAHA